jgi:hypothetical protein
MNTLDYNPVARCTNGQRYEDMVPDTLDLADRLALAVNALTRVWYPDERWALGFKVDFSQRPAVISPNHVTDAYLNIPPKFIEALVLARLASGTELNLDVDREVLGAQLELLGEDGLTYCPTDALLGFSEPRPFAEIWGEGRMLAALSTLAQVDDNPLWIDVAKRKVDRLLSLTREKEGFRFLWKGRFRPNEQVPINAGEPTGNLQDGSLLDRFEDPQMPVLYSTGAIGHGAGLLYCVTGYEPALELSRGLARWAMTRVFDDPEGRWAPYHFHHSLYAVMAMCVYAVAAGDREMLERVDACYRWARAIGDPLIGYYTEWIPGSDQYLRRGQGNTVETCEVADMVFLALYLTRAGIGDYWDDVDRWLRNVYAEAQMLDERFIEHLPDDYLTPDRLAKPHQDDRDVAARSVGSFWGWMRANNGIRIDRTEQGPKLPPSSIMHCCTANGARTLYHVWDSIVSRQDGEVRVNLLLNRASPWLDVDSYLPVEGKVVLRIKDALRVAMRMPEWCDPRGVRATLGGKQVETQVDGRYLRIDGTRPGDMLTLTFAVPERTTHRVVGEIPYKLTLRGSNVVGIDPRGEVYPLYERQPSGKTVPNNRFVPDIGQIVW